MKKFTLTLALATTCSLAAFADDQKPAAGGPGGGPGGPGGEHHHMMASPDERVKMMKEKLNLTDDQAAKIKAVLEKSEEKMKALRADTAGSADDKRAKFRDALKAQMDEISPILTPEQQTKWKEEMAQHRPGGSGGPGAAGGPGGHHHGPGGPDGAGKPAEGAVQ